MSIVHIENCEGYKIQWRFMWNLATGEEMGAQWRDAEPEAEEIEEWKKDFLSFWIERRAVFFEEPKIIEYYHRDS